MVCFGRRLPMTWLCGSRSQFDGIFWGVSFRQAFIGVWWRADRHAPALNTGPALANMLRPATTNARGADMPRPTPGQIVHVAPQDSTRLYLARYDADADVFELCGRDGRPIENAARLRRRDVTWRELAEGETD